VPSCFIGCPGDRIDALDCRPSDFFVLLKPLTAAHGPHTAVILRGHTSVPEGGAVIPVSVVDLSRKEVVLS